MANPPVPVTNHYPIQLHYIKALFLHGQYRQCIQACRDLTKLVGTTIDENPLQKTYVNFYLGLCHDEIARLMHHNSSSKVPAFNSAQQYYQDAIDALPSPQEVQFLCAITKSNKPTDRDSLFDDDDDETVSEFPISPTISAYDPRDMGISRASSPILSSPPIFRREPVLSPPVGSPGTITSDFDDLEDHDSFSELMTPNRVKRDFSRMSLLGQPPKRLSRDLSRISLLEPSKGLPRDMSRMSLIEQEATIPREFSKISLHDPPPPKRIKSPTHSLMRPIRLGSPAKPTFLPPTLSYSTTTANIDSRLPRLAKDTKTEPNLTASRIDSRYSSPEPPPISPEPKMDSAGSLSDASTISQTSPHTPVRQQMVDSPSSTPREDLDQGSFFRMIDHVASMRTQLQNHIALVTDAKNRLCLAQEEKRASRLAPTTGTPLGTIRARKDVVSSPVIPVTSPPKPGLPQARSYWSFVPEDVKAMEKRRRIAAGRERKWVRERFQPGKYKELCERALEEL